MSSAETELERKKYVCCIYISSLNAILVVRLLSDHKKIITDYSDHLTLMFETRPSVNASFRPHTVFALYGHRQWNWKCCGLALPFSLKSTIFAYSVEMKLYTPLQRHIYVFNQTANESVKMHEVTMYKYNHALNWTKILWTKTCNWLYLQWY